MNYVFFFCFAISSCILVFILLLGKTIKMKDGWKSYFHWDCIVWPKGGRQLREATHIGFIYCSKAEVNKLRPSGQIQFPARFCKILVERCPIYLLRIAFVCFCATTAAVVKQLQQKLYGLQSLQYLVSGSLQAKFSGPYFRNIKHSIFPGHIALKLHALATHLHGKI